uniref:AlNc14C2450G13239 protein n=1 Tax=Albugo laibachii Nc14 TaxID=890382 RepID=F0X2Y0_9STRA|nr:AlNc14C2450G13239 [Albugo laibachii Nc14]|eukprot:CCA28343.1 AlNc14C2450G13239 [Albugo laibachii Nc14]
MAILYRPNKRRTAAGPNSSLVDWIIYDALIEDSIHRNICRKDAFTIHIQ